MKTDPTFWILARASGMTAYALLTSAVLVGLVQKSRVRNVLDLHRFLPLLAFGMLALHGVALVLDRTVHMPPAGLVVPGASPYRPIAVALGVLACELMVIVAASFSVRRRIGFRTWRRLHWLTYIVFLFATAHGITAGSDTPRPWAQNVYLAAVGAVVFATAWRTFARPALERRA